MKLNIICKSKIHRAVVTGADREYIGSIGIDAELLERSGIAPGEQVSVWNITTGARIETYAIALPGGSGEVVVNGAAAHHFQRGDRIIVAAFCLTDEPVKPHMIVVDDRNRWVRDLADQSAAVPTT
jgi:aspartate 1-decarboxylase